MMGRFAGDYVISHPTIAVYTVQWPIINANKIASHLDLGVQLSRSHIATPPYQITQCYVFAMLSVNIHKYKYEMNTFEMLD